MQCSHCQSNHTVKNGRRKGIQSYLCRNCGHQFRETHIQQGYSSDVDDGDHLVSKTAMTRVEGENSRLRHYLARLHRKTFCYSKSIEMLKASIRLLLYYLKHRQVPAF